MTRVARSEKSGKENESWMVGKSKEKRKLIRGWEQDEGEG